MKKMTWQQVIEWNSRTRRLFQAGELPRHQIRILESKWWWRPEIESTSKKNKELLLEMARCGEDRPSSKIDIGRMLPHYTKKRDKCYDEKFTMELRGLRPDWLFSMKNRRILKFREAVQWAIDHKRVPSSTSKDLRESRCAQVIQKVRSLRRGTARGSFYQEYQHIIDELGVHDLLESTKGRDATIRHAKRFFDWCVTNKRLPSQRSIDPVERRMGIWISRIRSLRKGTRKGVWHPELLDIASQYGFPDIFDDKSGGLNWKNDAHTCFSFCQNIGRLPSKWSGDIEEAKWACWLSRRRRARSGKNSSKWHPEYLDIAAEYGFPNAFDPQPIGGAARREKPGGRTKVTRPKPVAKHHSVLRHYIQTGEMR